MTTDTTTYTPWQLARMADCADPDTAESPGAVFLARIVDDVAEAFTYDPDATVDSLDRDGTLHEIADNAVPTYTHHLWTTFVDLAAYQEDPSELGADGSDMEQCAQTCLYMIAERLARALAEEHDEADDEDGEG